jgi:Cysteine-rich CPCC
MMKRGDVALVDYLFSDASGSKVGTMQLLQCPCCDYFTLEKRVDWEICPVCYWEDDGHDLDLLDSPSGCNHGLTLRQGGENFRRLGACEPELVQYVSTAVERQSFKHVPRT